MSVSGCRAALHRWPLAQRVFRYTAGSVVAVVASETAFAVCYAAGAGPTLASVVAFVCGAAPNWALNRRWAWQRRGRLRIGREVVGYLAVSVVSLLAAIAVTSWTSRRVHTLIQDHAARVALVAAAYLATYGILFVAKFVLYELVIFADARDSSTRRRSRNQVASTTQAKRAP